MARTLVAKESGSFVALDDGVYGAVVAAVTTEEGDYGEYVKIIFVIEGKLGDDGTPVELWAFAAAKLTSKSKLGMWVSALVPINFRERQSFDLDTLVDLPCRIVVTNEPSSKGEMRPVVTRVMKPRAEAEQLAEEQDAPPWESVDSCAMCSEPVWKYIGSTAFCKEHAEKLGTR